ncbi:triose-phosphate isomerase [Mycoplasmopsis felifaucium]|uniref:triose-phosphate isomerase n=1 Tax=Mycoplasmopsis felifaucium TaxID=35768 RepID=UPI0004818D4E|nr:triose-phosphate isomerase [Mycoplasmopsis felifaucium]
MKKFIIIGNWKMNNTFTETLEFYKEFASRLKKFKKTHKDLEQYIDNNTFAIAPAHCNLAAYCLNKAKQLKLCSQNMSRHDDGAYTGEVSARMLQDLNVSYALCGHSERRKYHSQHENDEMINKKIRQAVKYNITPIICIGESKDDRDNNRTEESLRRQLKALLNEVNIDKVIVAYEPVWAIGTGETPTAKEVQQASEMIHRLTSPNVPVLYGGSVNISNISEFANEPDINGFLVGGASLDIDQFLQLISVHSTNE